MDIIVKISEAFVNVFQYCADYFISFLTGIVPIVLMLLTFFNAIVAALGQKRIEKIAVFFGKNKILAYTIYPIICWLLLCNPMMFSMAKFLPPRQRVGYYEAATPLSGPLMCFFPHVNPAEYFIWWGIASGVDSLGYNLIPMGARYLVAAILVGLMRALVAERIWLILAKREGRTDLIESNMVSSLSK